MTKQFQRPIQRRILGSPHLAHLTWFTSLGSPHLVHLTWFTSLGSPGAALSATGRCPVVDIADRAPQAAAWNREPLVETGKPIRGPAFLRAQVYADFDAVGVDQNHRLAGRVGQGRGDA
jgi:hypothetical protein